MDRNLFLYLLAQKGISQMDLEETIGWSTGTRMSRITHGRGWKVSELKILIGCGFTKDEIWNIFFKEDEER